MDLAGLELTTADAAGLRGRLAAAAAAEPVVTPSDLLSDPTSPAPAGWHRVDLRRRVRRGDLDAVRTHLLGWDVLRSVGIDPVADTAQVRVGSTVVQRLPARGPGVLAPCRVVAVLDTADAAGFLYAALPGHPLAGEEAFVARRVGTDVEVRVTSRSRPAAGAATRLVSVLHVAQAVAARGYLRSMARAAEGARRVGA